jgi:PAS domain S-box-containing protein
MLEPSNKILCVDDQAEITQLLEQQLRGPYEVEFANSAAQALQLIAAQGPFAVILADYAMPEMDGVALLREVSRRSPDTVGIMLTAFADVSVALSAMHDASVFRFVRKPWEPDQLRVFIDEALEKYRVAVSERNLAATLGKVNQRLYERVQALESNQAALQRRLDLSPVAMFEATIQDGEPRLTYVSQAIQGITGMSAAEILACQSPWEMLIDGEDRDSALSQLSGRPDDAPAPQGSQYRLRHADGHSVPVRSITRRLNGSGDADQVLGVWITV